MATIELELHSDRDRKRERIERIAERLLIAKASRQIQNQSPGIAGADSLSEAEEARCWRMARNIAATFENPPE